MSEAKVQVEDLLDVLPPPKEVEQYTLEMVPDLRQVRLHPRLANVREDLPEIEKMMESIRKNGLIHPLTALKQTVDGSEIYWLVAGHRRRAALEMFAKKYPEDYAARFGLGVPVSVKGPYVEGASVTTSLLLQLEENLAREDVNPLHLARRLDTLRTEHGLSHAELATHLGKDRSYVTKLFGLLKNGSPELHLAIEAGLIGLATAFDLNRLPHDDQIAKLKEYREIAKEQIDTGGDAAHVRKRRRAIKGFRQITPPKNAEIRRLLIAVSKRRYTMDDEMDAFVSREDVTAEDVLEHGFARLLHWILGDVAECPLTNAGTPRTEEAPKPASKKKKKR